MTAEESLIRAEDLLARLEQARTRLEGTDDPDQAVDILQELAELAKEVELPIMIHTPHRDKKRGTLRTMDVLKEHNFDPARCVIDHNNEETVAAVLERGYFAGFSIYPQTKMSNERMTEIVRHNANLPFLPKPFDGETLKARVRAILAAPVQPTA